MDRKKIIKQINKVFEMSGMVSAAAGLPGIEAPHGIKKKKKKKEVTKDVE